MLYRCILAILFILRLVKRTPQFALKAVNCFEVTGKAGITHNESIATVKKQACLFIEW